MKKSRRDRAGIYGVGVDIEDINRFKKIIKNESFLKKVYTEHEVKYCRSFSYPESHLAARFAGKEAVLKALGSMRHSLMPNQIEILRAADGAPFVKIKERRLQGLFDYYISLSHSQNTAVAFVTVYKR